MQSEDTYRLKLNVLAASIKAWSGFIADVARIETADEAEAWRLRIEPKAKRACPLELVVDSRTQSCDLTLAGETYEDWKLPTLDLVLPLVVAVSEGRVITRRMTSTATSLPVSVTTIVTLADGTRLEPPGAHHADAFPGGRIEQRDTHYVPYRKPGK
jgi:hypothetical protein